MCDSYLKCNYCGELFGWESGHPIKGNIYSCEDCGENFCIVCYEERTGKNIDVLIERDDIQCPDCFNIS